MGISKKISVARLRKLRALLKEASQGRWLLQRGLMNDALWITTDLREMDFGKDGREGPICHVSKERTVAEKSSYGDSRTYRKIPHKNADHDANLIIEAVNALPDMIDALLGSGRADETGWLIEFAASKYAPIRYYAAGEQAVMSASDATRFCRERDAKAVISAEKLGGCKPTEHAWIDIDEQVPA